MQLTAMVAATAAHPLSRGGRVLPLAGTSDVDATEKARREAIANAAAITYDQHELLGVVQQYLSAVGLHR